VSILSQAEIAAYRTDGVVVPEFRLSPDKLSHLQSLAARLIADNPHMGDEPVASPHVPGSGVQNVRSDPAWIDVPTFAPILDMVEQLIGPERLPHRAPTAPRSDSTRQTDRSEHTLQT